VPHNEVPPVAHNEAPVEPPVPKTKSVTSKPKQSSVAVTLSPKQGECRAAEPARERGPSRAWWRGTDPSYGRLRQSRRLSALSQTGGSGTCQISAAIQAGAERCATSVMRRRAQQYFVLQKLFKSRLFVTQKKSRFWPRARGLRSHSAPVPWGDSLCDTWDRRGNQ
jgi:hypothetical protein